MTSESKNINNQKDILHPVMSQCQVGFRELVERVKLRFEPESFALRDRAMFEELCYIIAEIYKLPPAAPVKIEGIPRAASSVAEVYSMLTDEHLQHVIDEFCKLTYKVNYRKSYMRTALYNSVFEMASEAANDMAVINSG